MSDDESVSQTADKAEKLSRADIRQLLIHIEANGGRAAKFTKVYNEHSIYDDAGSDRRRQFSKKLGKLREKSPPSYIAELKKAGVKPSQETLDEEYFWAIEQERIADDKKKLDKSHAPAAPPVEVEHPDEVLEDVSSVQNQQRSVMNPMQVDEQADDISVDDVSALLNGLSVTPPRARRAVASHASPPGVAFPGNVRIPDYAILPADGQSNGDPAHALLTRLYARMSGNPNIGSVDNPAWLPVSLSRPECNGPVTVKRVPDHKEGRHYYTAFQLESMVDPADANEWNVYIPERIPTLLMGRVVVVRRPSLTWSQKNLRDPIQQRIRCNKLETVDEKVFSAVANDTSRQYSYTFLVFPEGTQLDNSVKSPTHGLYLRRQLIPIVVPEEDSPIGQSLNRMCCSWIICNALSEIGDGAGDGSQDNIDLSVAFAR